MQEMLQQIINVIGVNENFELKEANVLNIEATIADKKKIHSIQSRFYYHC